MFSALSPLFGKFVYIFLGIFFGVLFCAAFFFFVVFDKEEDSTKKAEILSLVLTEPSDSLTTDNKTLTLSGKTFGASVVTINSPLKNLVIESNNGNFSAKIDLMEGKNTINVTVFNKSSGVSQTLSRDVLFLDEDLTTI